MAGTQRVAHAVEAGAGQAEADNGPTQQPDLTTGRCMSGVSVAFGFLTLALVGAGLGLWYGKQLRYLSVGLWVGAGGALLIKAFLVMHRHCCLPNRLVPQHGPAQAGNGAVQGQPAQRPHRVKVAASPMPLPSGELSRAVNALDQAWHMPSHRTEGWNHLMATAATLSLEEQATVVKYVLKNDPNQIRSPILAAHFVAACLAAPWEMEQLGADGQPVRKTLQEVGAQSQAARSLLKLVGEQGARIAGDDIAKHDTGAIKLDWLLHQGRDKEMLQFRIGLLAYAPTDQAQNNQMRAFEVFKSLETPADAKAIRIFLHQFYEDGFDSADHRALAQACGAGLAQSALAPKNSGSR